jgi:hypothetical protein
MPWVDGHRRQVERLTLAEMLRVDRPWLSCRERESCHYFVSMPGEINVRPAHRKQDALLSQLCDPESLTELIGEAPVHRCS